MLNRTPGIKLGLKRFTSPPGFVIFHIGRSGSSVLTDMLNQNQRIECASEIFHGYYGEVGRREALARKQNADTPWLTSKYFPDRYEAYIRESFREASMRAIIGFEMKFAHATLSSIKMEDFAQALKALNFRNFIILKRKNYLRKIVSSLVGKKRQLMHIQRGEKSHLQTISIDVESLALDSQEKSLMQFLEDYDKGFDEIHKILHNDNKIEVSYEKDIENDPNAAYRKVCEFLGVVPTPAQVTLARTTPFPLKEIISNYGEVCDYLKGSPYEWMTEESSHDI